jgi:hypothetical protein
LKFDDARVNDQKMAVTDLLDIRQFGPGMKMESRETLIAGSRIMSLDSFVDHRLTFGRSNADITIERDPPVYHPVLSSRVIIQQPQLISYRSSMK